MIQLDLSGSRQHRRLRKERVRHPTLAESGQDDSVLVSAHLLSCVMSQC